MFNTSNFAKLQGEIGLTELDDDVVTRPEELVVDEDDDDIISVTCIHDC